MLLLPFILLVSVLIAYAFGGSLRNLASVPGIPYREGGAWVLSGWKDPRLRFWLIAPVALAMQAVPLPVLEGPTGRALPVGVLLISYALLTGLAAANWRMPGFVLILIGVALNFVVIAANQGMPVSEEALRNTGQIEAIRDLDQREGAKHHLAGEEDVLRPLGDVIGIGPPFNAVISPGDVAAYAGAAIFLVEAMLGFPASTTRRSGRHRPPKATRLGIQR